MSTVLIIGAGLGGLSAASYLAKAGHRVTILEKNNWIGGRVQTWKMGGFNFDMGPSWYWMPEIFAQYYADFGHHVSDFYQLKRLSPSYRIYFADEHVDMLADKKGMCQLFEHYELGSGERLNSLLKKAETVYNIAMKEFVPQPLDSWSELLDWKKIVGGLQILAQYNGFQSTSSFLQNYFHNEKLLKIMAFPIFFLGGSIQNIPALYAILNHVDINLGTWYPMGGMGKITDAFATIAKEQEVEILLNQEVKHIGEKTVTTTQGEFSADIIITNADYHHVEDKLVDPAVRNYSEEYWNERKLAPSALLIYLGVEKKLQGLIHHTLFFHNDWSGHNLALFDNPNWPEKPLYYTACPTKTDASLAPEGCEILTILMPIAAGLQDSPQIREKYYESILTDLEKKIGTTIRDSVVVKRIYSLNDFVSDYNAYKGNAYGLAQTLKQTAFYRPKHSSNHQKNLFYTGHFTNPGIGLPMVVLSGKTVAQEVEHKLKRGKVE
jgi:phytoene desaturase